MIKKLKKLICVCMAFSMLIPANMGEILPIHAADTLIRNDKEDGGNGGRIDVNGTSSDKTIWEKAKGKYSSYGDGKNKALEVDSSYAYELTENANGKKTKYQVEEGDMVPYGDTISHRDSEANGGSATYTSSEKHPVFIITSSKNKTVRVRRTNLSIYSEKEKKFIVVDVVNEIANIRQDEADHGNDKNGYIQLSNGLAGIRYAGNVKSLTMRNYFYKPGTTTPVTIKTNITLQDIDAGQYIGVAASRVDGQYVDKNTMLTYTQREDGWQNYWGPAGETVNTANTAVGFVFESSYFGFTFGKDVKFAMTGDPNAYSEPTGYNQYIRSTQNNMGIPKISDAYKTVSADGDENQQDKTSIAVSDMSKAWTYKVTQPIATGLPEEWRYDRFEFHDQIEECMKIEDIKVVASDGSDEKNVTSEFNITTDHNKVEAKLKDPGGSEFYDYGLYVLEIKVKMNISDNITEKENQSFIEKWKNHGHLNSTETAITENNKAYTIIDDTTNNTNDVSTTIHLPTTDMQKTTPGLKIDKSVSPYEYQVNDTVDYTVTAKNYNADANTVYFTLEDTTLPNTMELDFKSIKVEGIDASNYTLSQSGNGWILKSKGEYALPYENEIKVTYRAKALIAANGTLVDNTAKGWALGVPATSDSEQVYINSPKTDVKKTAPQKLYKKGDIVTYTIDVSNRNPGTYMRNVQFNDEIHTKGVTVVPGSLSIINGTKDVTGQCDIAYREDGSGFDIKTPFELYNEKIPAIESSFGIATNNYKDVQLASKLQVRYQMMIEVDEIQENKIKNVFEAPATENINNVVIKEDASIPSGGGSDDENVELKAPKLQITKSSDKKTYGVGDIGTYTLEVKQTKEDLTARNVVIEDAFEKEGMKISNIQVIYNGSEITTDCKIEVGNQQFRIETNKNLTQDDRIKIIYQVTFEEMIEGSIKNLAIADSENTDIAQANNLVTLTTPTLKVEKSSDKQVYETGAIGSYKLLVRQTKVGATARQVVIKDRFEKEGMEITGIHVAYNKKDITNECEIQLDENKNQFEIHTKKDLSDSDEMIVTYKVKFSKMIPGNIKNIVRAEAKDTTPSKDELTVTMLEAIPKLSIHKTSNKQGYKVGEIGTYTLTIGQTVPGAKATNIRISDKIKEKGVSIYKNSITILDANQKNVTKQCKIVRKDKSFSIQTQASLSYDQQMKVSYKVKFKKETLAGKQIHNVAIAKGKETKKVKTKHTVKVQQLNIISTNKDTRTTLRGTTAHTGDSGEIQWFVRCCVAGAFLVFFLKKRYNKKKS